MSRRGRRTSRWKRRLWRRWRRRGAARRRRLRWRGRARRRAWGYSDGCGVKRGGEDQPWLLAGNNGAAVMMNPALHHVNEPALVELGLGQFFTAGHLAAAYRARPRLGAERR